MAIKDYPHLDAEEFTEACHYLDLQYCRAQLGPLRKKWKLRLCRSLDVNLAFMSNTVTYIQIIRPLEQTQPQYDELSLDLSRFSLSEKLDETIPMADDEMLDSEDADAAALSKNSQAVDVGFVVYEIHLHPTYRVPCLWFTLHNLPAGEPAFNIDTVFRRLVPDNHKAELRVNGIGGISADHHPLTGLPSFFIHPCLLGDAMSNFEGSVEKYLMIWLGLVGACVGLWVPMEMANQ